MTEPKHKPEEAKGRLKKGTGEITGNDSLRREGAADKGSAKSKSFIDKASDKAKDAADSVKEAVTKD